MRNIVIIGGGLAGLISSIQLIRAGISCTVIEKKSYPLHRVCGEYISNEALPFLKASGLYPEALKVAQIKFLEISSINGKSFRLTLDLGGFGISRYAFDNFLYRIAKQEGVLFHLNSEVTSVLFRDEKFEVQTQFGNVPADLVVGAFGKRSKIDVQQKRDFIKRRSPFMGVKYHVRTNHPADLISLHNFRGGYCGVCNVEDGVTNLCYLTHRDPVRQFGDIQEMERAVLFQNPLIRNIFQNSGFVFNKPEVINEISFETKAPVENHILMAGDAAGMITPVCGNGMAIAIHSAKILSDHVIDYCKGRTSRQVLEQRYRKDWNTQFQTRLWFGRNVQRLFGQSLFSTVAVNVARSSKTMANLIVSRTHGQPF
ncbi:MAG: NAD(P)/FAD-dependent oxidoreductase [Cyclobacteriaceae bacterium]